MKKILLTILILINFAFGAEIRGKIINKYTNEPEQGVEVAITKYVNLFDWELIDLLNYSPSQPIAINNSREDGTYIFRRLPVGKYILKIISIGLCNKWEDTVVINNDTSKICKNIYSDFPSALKLNPVQQIENYQKYFSKLSNENKLNIRIDSICEYQMRLKVFTTFQNNSDSTIYIMYESENNHISYFTDFYIRDIYNNNTNEKQTYIDMSHDVVHIGAPFINFDTISIKPKSSRKYVPINSNYDFSRVKDGIYKILLTYHTIEQDWLGGLICDKEKAKEIFKEQIYFRQIALRGKYEANEYIYIKKTGNNIERIYDLPLSYKIMNTFYKIFNIF